VLPELSEMLLVELLLRNTLDLGGTGSTRVICGTGNPYKQQISGRSGKPVLPYKIVGCGNDKLFAKNGMLNF